LPIQPELYDLISDPEESYDVADKHADVVTDIQSRIERLIAGFPEDIRKAHEETRARKTLRTPAGAVTRSL
jgi:hypothetical protein